MQRHGRVAQWTRARGYEPRSRGFKSLLAHDHHLSSLARYAKTRNFLLYPSSQSITKGDGKRRVLLSSPMVSSREETGPLPFSPLVMAKSIGFGEADAFTSGDGKRRAPPSCTDGEKLDKDHSSPSSIGLTRSEAHRLSTLGLSRSETPFSFQERDKSSSRLLTIGFGEADASSLSSTVTIDQCLRH